MGVRVHQLASELRMSTKELAAYLRTQGRSVSSCLAMVEDTVANIVRDRLAPKAPPPKETAKSGAGNGAAKTSGGSDTRRRDTNTPGGAGDRQRRKDEFGPDAPPAGSDRGKRGRVRVFVNADSGGRGGGGGGAGFRRRGGGGGGRGRPDGGRRQQPTIPDELPDSIEVEAPVSIKDLSAELGIKSQLLVKKLFEKGKMININASLDEEQILELGVDLGVDIIVKTKEEEMEEAIRVIEEQQVEEGDLIARAPIVTFLGHVDHGKTSLLDKIRETKITNREAGGITQHLGAYQVDRDDAKVTFIDTPGHKAFTEMRARGASATDIAVLVVAADDGPKPQTEEAINHARAAGVPIVVALNKIDRPEANPAKCKEQLASLNLIPSEWGGDTEFCEVSAITGEGIDGLLETLGLVAEILELKADPARSALGVVLEAESTTNRGVVTTVLVKDGTLNIGDYILCGASHGRARTLTVNGERVTSAGPASPVQIIGLSEVPATGDKLYVFENEKQARQVAGDRDDKLREEERAQRRQVTLENLFDHLEDVAVQELRLIVKADVRGSIEALARELEDLSHEEVRIRILHSGVGAITQEDVQLATASQAIIIGFHVTADKRARMVAEENDVDIRNYKIIYEALDDVKAALEARLAPEIEEVIHGQAEIRQIYKASRLGNIAGCYVIDGKLLRTDKARLIRDGTIIYTGDLSSLKRFKDDAKEVREGFECGIKIKGYEDIKVGDIIEGFGQIEKKRTL